MKEKIDNFLIKLFLDTKRKYIKKIKQIFYPPMIIEQGELNNGERKKKETSSNNEGF